MRTEPIRSSRTLTLYCTIITKKVNKQTAVRRLHLRNEVHYDADRHVCRSSKANLYVYENERFQDAVQMQIKSKISET